MIKQGIVLIEFAVVIALLICIAFLSMGMIALTNHAYVRAELEKFSACVHYLQRKAQLEKKQIILHIDTQKNRYYGSGIMHSLSRGVMFGIQLQVKGPPATEQALLAQAVTFKEQKIFFYPDGTLSAGSIYFTDTKKSCLFALTCAVAQVSYIRTYRFDKKWLLLS